MGKWKVFNTMFRRIEINFWNVVIENVDIRWEASTIW
jgi:hypothetical protein